MTQEAQTTRETALPAPRLTADVYETEGGDIYVIELPVPGLKADEIIVEADSYAVTVSTKPLQSETDLDRKYIQREQSTRSLSRIFEFPVELDTDRIQTKLENGMLKIYIPKAAIGRRRVIRVGQAA